MLGSYWFQIWWIFDQDVIVTQVSCKYARLCSSSLPILAISFAVYPKILVYNPSFPVISYTGVLLATTQILWMAYCFFHQKDLCYTSMSEATCRCHTAVGHSHSWWRIMTCAHAVHTTYFSNCLWSMFVSCKIFVLLVYIVRAICQSN